MNTNDRIRRVREVEKLVDKLVDKGWTKECVTFQDEADAPYKAEIHMYYEPPSALGGRDLICAP